MSQDRWQFTTLATIGTVAAVVSSLGAPLVPSIAAEYDVPLTTAQWVLTSTLIAGAVMTPVLGRCGSGRMRRPVILAALGAVLLGSLLTALPLGLGALIAGRALQGIGLALIPLVLAVARDLWTGSVLASRLSYLSVTTVAGAGLGYPLTAGLAQWLGLTGAYWFGAGLMLATLLLAWRYLPQVGDGPAPRVDLIGFALLSVGSVSFLLAVSQGEKWGWSSTPILALAVAGFVASATWVIWSRHPTPRTTRLVDLSLAGRRGVVGPNLVAFGVGMGMYALLTFAVIVVRADGSAGFGLGLSVAAAGLVLVPYAVLSVAGSRVALAVSRAVGPKVLLPTGALVFGSSLVMMALVHDHLWQVLTAMAIGGLGSGFTFSSMATLIVPHVPAAETGSAMAFNQLLRYLGFSAGSAVSVALISLFGGGAGAFAAAALTLAAVCVVSATLAVTVRGSRVG
ncbi:MFS transporter [Nocardioides limicola]|uniref:MFS transporter n=1 Tax=Nocardioides limicola TaxID=2803368 RepID=UPI00193B9A7C|nr:MFS transporter [Nocardioides sp. DJM-14]